MTKMFKLVGIMTSKIYFESNERSKLQRWLDVEFGATYSRTKGKKTLESMPEAMR